MKKIKVLVIRFSSIGDIVLTTPVLRCLKSQVQDVEIHYAVKEKFLSVIASNPHVDKIHVLKDSLKAFIKTLKAENFDYVIDLHNNLRTRVIKSKLKVKSQSFKKLNYQKWLYVNFKINKMPNVHIVDRYMDALSVLGVKNDQKGLDYFIPFKDEVEESWLPESHRKGYVAFVIGGSYFTKKLPFTRMVQLCDQINRPVVLLGGKEDEEVGNKIEEYFDVLNQDQAHSEVSKSFNKKTIIYNACGKYNINQSADLVRKAKVVFSHDTGLMHIAAAFKKKIYSIWGNTTPDMGMYPYKTEFVIFENNKLKCRPCSKLGHKSCPKKHFKCMNDLFFDFWIP